MRIFICIMFIFIWLFALSFNLNADIIYLQNGKKIEGKVIDENAQQVLIEVSAGKIRINSASITKIEKKEFKTVKNKTFKEKNKANQLFQKEEVIKIAKQNITSSLSGIIITKIDIASSKIQEDKQIYQIRATYKTRYRENNQKERTINLLYTYNIKSGKWSCPKKSTILELDKSDNPITSARVKDPGSKNVGLGKDIQFKHSPRHYRKLFGPGQERDNEEK